MAGNEQTVIDWIEATGTPHRVTSTVRHGSITSSGNVSCHDAGNTTCSAVDFAGPQPGRDTPELAAIFWSFEPVFHLMHELIYADVPFNIKRGKKVAPYAVANHHDHVHAAVLNGTRLPIEEAVMAISEDDVDRIADATIAKLMATRIEVGRSTVSVRRLLTRVANHLKRLAQSDD